MTMDSAASLDDLVEQARAALSGPNGAWTGVAVAEWRYFISGPTPELAEDGKAGIVRLPVGATVSLAEAVLPEGEWRSTDRMARVLYQGSDYQFVEIDAGRARQLMRHWVEIGRLAKYPTEEPNLDPGEQARLTAMDHRADEIWRGVPRPSGADDIR